MFQCVSIRSSFFSGRSFDLGENFIADY